MGKSTFNPSLIMGLKFMVLFFVPVLQKLYKFSAVPNQTTKRFTEIVREQIKIRDSGSVQCEDVLQFVLDGRKKFGKCEKISFGSR